MPGPPPKAPGTRARRNASPAVVYLPAGGRRGETPPWPLLDDVTMQVQARMAEDRAERLREEMNDVEDKRSLRRMERELDKALQTASILDEQIRRTREVELDLWTELWATPQAQMWEQLAWTREVAQYVRWKVRGEMGDLDAAKEARAWSDRLGLNPLAMLRLRFEIERTDEAAARGNERRQRAASKPTQQPKGTDPRTLLSA